MTEADKLALLKDLLLTDERAYAESIHSKIKALEEIINEQKSFLNQEDIDVTSIDIEDRKAFATLKASGLMNKLVDFAALRTKTKKHADCRQNINKIIDLLRTIKIQYFCL